MISLLPFLLCKAGTVTLMKYNLAKAWDLFWCYSGTPGTRRKGDRWRVACPASPAHLPTSPGHTCQVCWHQIRRSLSMNWNKLPGKHPSVKSVLGLVFVLSICAFFLRPEKKPAKSRAGEEPLKADLKKLTGTITQYHSCFPKMLNAGFFVLLFLAYAAVTCSYIHSWHGASASNPFSLLFHMASFFR